MSARSGNLTAAASCPASAQPEPRADAAALTNTAQRLRVLIIGESSDEDACDVYRSRMFVGPLSRLGVDVRYAMSSIESDRPINRLEIERRTAVGVERLTAEMECADVVVFRRAYHTHSLCLECEFATLDAEGVATHSRATGHTVNGGPDPAVRRLFEGIATNPGVARRLAIVYETDDDLLRLDPSNGQGRVIRHEQDLIKRMIGRADLVTTSTPFLAGRLASLTTEVRVVRNAIDPAWYGDRGTAASADLDDSINCRLVYYGSMVRLRDYAVCAPAVDAIARAGARRVWFGAPDVESFDADIVDMFDEIHPYVTSVPVFARALAGLRPAIGLAPLIASPFAQSKSELHWLEYSMAGAATVATSLSGGGPYDVIRHGVDGFLASSRAEWRWALERLAASAGLRAEVAGRARSRVVAEYGVDLRAIEWAAAYRWAADHAGRGLNGVPRNALPTSPSARVGSDIVRANRAERRRSSRAAQVSRLSGSEDPCEQPPAGPPAAAILEAYVAAQAFAHRSPLRLLLGADGSANEAAAGHPAADGWITVDTAGKPDVRHDVLFGLPFGDGSVDAIEAHHVLEERGALTSVLTGEAARVLRAGGTFRVVTADRMTALANQRTLAAQGVVLVGRSARLPDFTAETLERLLVKSGFVGVVRHPASPGQLILEATR